MRVLHVDTERRWGGGENQLLLLVRGMLKRGHEAEIAAQPESALLLRAKNLKLSCHELSVSGDADAATTRGLRVILRRCSPDVIHMHTAHAHGVRALACGRKRYESFCGLQCHTVNGNTGTMIMPNPNIGII